MNNKVLIIAEAGVNHNGSYENAKKLILAGAEAGVDYVKFQTFKASKLVSKDAEKAEYQKRNTTDESISQFEMLKKLEMPEKWHYDLIQYAESLNVKFLSTGFDEESIDFLESINIDLFKINDQCVTRKSLSNKINLVITCSMMFVNNLASEKKITHCGYYLYPRSSTGSKTPLRLSNSVGIIDSGYRGNLIACFDNHGNDDFTINVGDRLVQLCSPNITYPTLINIVSSQNKLELKNSTNRRMKGGFGSTGT